MSGSNLHFKPNKVWVLLLAFVCIINIRYATAAVRNFKKESDGVLFTLNKGILKIKVCTADIVEVKYTQFNNFQEKESLVVNNKWTTPVAFTVADAGNSIIITTARLKVVVDKATNAISYLTKSGALITSEDKTANKSMQAATIAGIKTYNCITQFNSPADEALFGLGCHPTDSLANNYKGRDQQMLIKYMTGAIPVLLSTKGYGLCGITILHQIFMVPRIIIPSSNMYRKAANRLIITSSTAPILIISSIYIAQLQARLLCSLNGHSAYFNLRTGI